MMEVSPPPNIVLHILLFLRLSIAALKILFDGSMIMKQLDSGHCDVIIIFTVSE